MTVTSKQTAVMAVQKSIRCLRSED